MELFVIIIMFMILSTGGVLGAVFWDKKYEDMLPVTHFVLILMLFFSGLTDNLILGVWIICAIVVVGYLVCILYIIKNKLFDKLKTNFFTECFWIFLASYFLIYICNIGKETHYWDEFVCWASRVKEMCRLDTLYTSELAHIGAKHYPPTTALIQYLYERIQYIIVGERKFIAWYLFVSYQIFMISLIMPLLGKVKIKRKNLQFYILSILLLILPLMFFANAYDTIMVDQLLGIMLGYCFVLLLSRKDDVFGLIVFTLCQITIMFTKDTGIYFCLLIWIFWIIDVIVENYYKNGKWVHKHIVWNTTGFAVFLFMRYLWNQHLVRGDTLNAGASSAVTQANELISINTFVKMIFGLVRDYRQAAFLNFCSAFFAGDRERKYFDVGCYDIGSFNLGSFNLGVSYFVLFMFFVILSVYLYRCYKGNYDKKRYQYMTIGVGILMLGYMGIILLTVLFLFNEIEANGLSCYDRYISMVFLMTAYILIFHWIKFKWNEKGNPSLYILLTLCLLIPGEPLIQFLDRQNVYDSQIVEASYIKDVNKIEKLIGDNESKICYFNLDDEYALLRYEKLRYGFDTNQIFNMLGEENKLVSKKDRDTILKQYDYILIYNNTNRFRRLIDAETENIGSEDFDIYRIQDMKLRRIL